MEQSSFNHWVRSLAYYFKTSTDEVMKLALVKEEKIEYTGEYFDYSEGDYDDNTVSRELYNSRVGFGVSTGTCGC